MTKGHRWEQPLGAALGFAIVTVVLTVAGTVGGIGVSVDSVDSHHGWSADIAETQGHGLNFPLIGDEDRTVATLYGMIHPNSLETATVRTVFINGEDIIISPAISDQKATARFPKGFTTLKPYLRLTPQPNR